MALDSSSEVSTGQQAPVSSPAGFRWWFPRTETVILLGGLACTVWGKMEIIVRQRPESGFVNSLAVVLPDVFFFFAVALLIRLLYILKPSVAVARCALVMATAVSVWSVCNMGWLMRSGVQLQPGLVVVLFRDFKEILPIVASQFVSHLIPAILLLIAVFAAVAFFVWRLYRPLQVVAVRFLHVRWAAVKLLIVLLLLMIQPIFESQARSNMTSEVLDFSSQWRALVSSTAGLSEDEPVKIATRNIQRAGERQVVVPDGDSSKLPNIVLVLLESVSYCMTSLGDSDLDVTPYLAQLADEGVEFHLTRVPVSHTTKAYWSALTSTTPVIEADYVEAVPVDVPYEGLPTLLKRAGYRSGFFMMSKGSFECGPGFFHNLGFDHVWFREDLGDPSATLGYLSGDDFRLIEPAAEWIEESEKPYFLMVMTSVSHDPFNVPKWFDEPRSELYDKYLQSLSYTDCFLKELSGKLKELDPDDNTIFCVMGDHGTSFRSQTNVARWYPYEEVLRVPWVLRWPGHVEAGLEIDWPCSQLDVTPTILNLIGCDTSEAGFEGRDAFTPSAPDRRLYFSSWYSNSPIGYVEGNRKVVYWPYIDKVFEYDLARDQRERNAVEATAHEAMLIKEDLLQWQGRSRIEIDPDRRAQHFLYSRWQVFSDGRSAWANYVPKRRANNSQ